MTRSSRDPQLRVLFVSDPGPPALVVVDACLPQGDLRILRKRHADLALADAETHASELATALRALLPNRQLSTL